MDINEFASSMATNVKFPLQIFSLPSRYLPGEQLTKQYPIKPLVKQYNSQLLFNFNFETFKQYHSLGQDRDRVKMILIKNVNENKNKLLLFLRPKICRIKMSKIAEIVIENMVDKKNMYPINPSQDRTQEYRN